MSIEKMKARGAGLYEKYKYALPFSLVFFASLLVSPAATRMVFYCMAPFLIYGIWLYRDELKALLKTRSFVFLAAYLLYFGVSSLWSEPIDVVKLLKMLRNILAILVFTTSLALFLPKIKWPPRAALYFAALCLGWACVAALIFYVLGGNDISVRMRGIGRYENSIHLAYLLSYGLIAIICMALVRFEKRYLASWTILALGLVIFLALSQTRGAYVALAACIGMSALLGNLRIALALIGLAVIGASAIYFAGDSDFSRITARLDTHRFEIWADAIAGIKEKPWTGHGILTHPYFHPHVVKHSWAGWESAHNSFLGHAYSGGLAGFLLYAGLLGNMIWVALSSYIRARQENAVDYRTVFILFTLFYGICAGLFNFSHFVVNVHIHWLIFWLPFALIWQAERQNNARGVANAQTP